MLEARDLRRLKGLGKLHQRYFKNQPKSEEIGGAILATLMYGNFKRKKFDNLWNIYIEVRDADYFEQEIYTKIFNSQLKEWYKLKVYGKIDNKLISFEYNLLTLEKLNQILIGRFKIFNFFVMVKGV